MTRFSLRTRAALAALALAPVLAAAAPAATPSFPPGQKDYALAPAGTYGLDPAHAGVIARVSHLGYSMSVFRFDTVAGTLAWDPAQPEQAKVSATVQTASVTSNVKGFSTQIAGDTLLKSKAFPEATFVSKAFRKTDATHGQVDGDFTLMGKTRPVTFDVTLIGAGAAFGKPRIGMQARATINPQDYGLPAMFADPIEIVVDTEFERRQ